MVPVHIDDPEHMHLLGLLLKGFLERQLAIPAVQRRAAGLRGDFGVSAGSMSVTLSFSEHGVLIKKGITATARAASVAAWARWSISSPAAEICGLPLARCSARRMRVRGNVFALLPLLPIMLTPAAKVSRS